MAGPERAMDQAEIRSRNAAQQRHWG